LNELRVYQHFKQLGVKQIGLLRVPLLRGYDERLLVIEMSYVTPPYLIDFGKSKFKKPDFDQEAISMWEAQIAERFGENAGDVMQIHHQLWRKYGIYHGDPSPYNFNFGDDD